MLRFHFTFVGDAAARRVAAHGPGPFDRDIRRSPRLESQAGIAERATRAESPTVYDGISPVTMRGRLTNLATWRRMQTDIDRVKDGLQCSARMTVPMRVQLHQQGP